MHKILLKIETRNYFDFLSPHNLLIIFEKKNWEMPSLIIRARIDPNATCEYFSTIGWSLKNKFQGFFHYVNQEDLDL